MDRLLLKIPVFGNLINKAVIARWTRTLSTMFAAGVPLVEALDSVGGASGGGGASSPGGGGGGTPWSLPGGGGGTPAPPVSVGRSRFAQLVVWIRSSASDSMTPS